MKKISKDKNTGAEKDNSKEVAKKERTAVLIPARGGSKSIPLKNIKPIAGKPLLHWTVEAAVHSACVNAVFVATDNDIIASTVSEIENNKLSVVGRSEETATDTASTESVLIEFCEQNPEFDVVILIQATSPLLTSLDIDAAVKIWRDGGYDSLLSTVRQKRFCWEDRPDGARPLNYDFMKRPRRQEYDGFLVENGALYIARRSDIIKYGNRLCGTIGIYEMREETYYELDEPTDWVIIENLLKNRQAFSSQLPRTRSSQVIRMVMTDVDGVLTDAGMYYSEHGDELKKFSTYDGKAFEILRKRGIKTAILTAENTKIVSRRAEKIKADYMRQGVMDKLHAAREICESEGISFSEVAYVGDDLNDLELLRHVGLAACPVNATADVLGLNGIIHLTAQGGQGVIRSLLPYIFGEICDEQETCVRMSSVTHRPWGSYEILNEGPGWKVKRIRVRPGGRLSLQKHRHRAEHWVAVQGTPMVTIGKIRKEILPGNFVYIPCEEVHRLENEHNIWIELIEVQTGSYLGEDDIIRFEDVYGRISA